MWKVRLPGQGHSTPCILNGRIYLTTGDKADGQCQASLVCLEQSSGKLIWQTEFYRGPAGRMHLENSPATATPACDGTRLFLPCQTEKNLEVAAFGLDGKMWWRKTIAPYSTLQGYAASLTFYKSTLLVPTEGPGGCYLVALHRETGDIVWRKAIRNIVESYGAAVVKTVAGRDQLLLIGGSSTRGYDPENGSLLWECDGPAAVCVATPVADKDKVYATGGHPNRKLMAIRADGLGNVTQTHLAWASDAKAGYVPTPLLHDGLLYAVSDQGLLRCYDTADGKVLWSHEFKAPFYSSPVLVNQHLYLFDRKGKGYLVPIGRTKGEIIANEMPAGVFATPVILEGRIYLRTLEDFYCLAANPQAAPGRINGRWLPAPAGSL